MLAPCRRPAHPRTPDTPSSPAIPDTPDTPDAPDAPDTPDATPASPGRLPPVDPPPSRLSTHLPPVTHTLPLRSTSPVVACAQACDLLSHHEKILAEGAAARQKGESERREKQDLWRIGLPDRGRRGSLGRPEDRPSLLAVSADMMNQRKERPSLVGGFQVLSWETDGGNKVSVGL